MNFFHISLCIYTVIILYLSRSGNERIKSKLEKECSSQAIVVAIGVCYSYIIAFLTLQFKMHGWTADEVYQSRSGLNAYIYRNISRNRPCIQPSCP